MYKHGEFGNVLLTDNEFENLASSFGVELRDKAISFLDAYIEEKGYKSKSHNLAIRRWVIEAVNKQPKKTTYGGRKEIIPEWANKPSDLGDLEKRAVAKLLGDDPALADRAEKLKERLQGG